MNLQNVTVAGSGVLGSQIAFQSAFFGYAVTVYDINDEAINNAKERFTKLKGVYGEYFNDMEKSRSCSKPISL